MASAAVFLPLPPGKGRGEGVFVAERSTHGEVGLRLLRDGTVLQDPLTPALSRSGEREQEEYALP